MALLLMAIAFAACDNANTPARLPTAAPPPESLTVGRGELIVIGVSADLSGDQASIGKDLADAVDLAIEDFGRQIRGHDVRSEPADDGCSDAEMASDAAKGLVADGVAAVVGPMCTTGAQAANDVYEAAGVVHISPSATRASLSEQGERFFFRTAWRDDGQAAVQARYVLEALAADTVVVIDDGEPYGRTLAEAFVKAFEAGGGRVVSHDRLERGATEYDALARQVIAADPDAVLYEGLDPEGALLVASLSRESFEGDFVAPDSLFNAEDFIGTAGGAAEDAIVTAGPIPDQAFNDRFQARFGRLPATSFVLQAYDATRVILTAMEATATDSGGVVEFDREALAGALRADGFAGLTGSIRFDERGDRSGESARELGLSIYRVTNGVFEQVE